MDVKCLFKGNCGIAVVATLAIALCLLFSYVYLQDGDDGPSIRMSPEVGDNICWIQVNHESGSSHDFELVFSDIDEEGNATFITYMDGIPMDEPEMTPEIFLETIYFDTSSAESIGTETVTLDGEDYLCGIYLNDDGDTLYVTDFGLILKQDFNGTHYSAIFISSSLVG